MCIASGPTMLGGRPCLPQNSLATSSAVSPFLKVMVSDLPSPMSTVVIKITAPSSVSEAVGSVDKSRFIHNVSDGLKTTNMAHGGPGWHLPRVVSEQEMWRTLTDLIDKNIINIDASSCARSRSATSTRVDLDRLSVTNLTSAERPLHIHDCSHSFVVVACASRRPLSS